MSTKRSPTSLFVDSVEECLNAWHRMTYAAERGRDRLPREDLADFVQEVNGWSHMFFSKEDAAEQNKAWNPTFAPHTTGHYENEDKEVQEDDSKKE